MAPEATKITDIVRYNVVDILFTTMTLTACSLAASPKNHSSAKRKLLLLVV
jgi:hypothetical protein